jgi:hypothetical protein
MKARSFKLASAVFLLLFVSMASADIRIENPGTINYTGNGDSKVQSAAGSSRPVYLNLLSSMGILGEIDENGDATFESFDMAFDVDDQTGNTAQLQATAAATGTFCPVTGAATITMTARIRITEVTGNSIASTPCFIVLRNSANTSNTFTLTTGTSGSYSGSPFTSANPAFAAEVYFAAPTGTCSAAFKSAIASIWGTGSTGGFQIFDAAITPTLTGSCT